MKDSLLMQAMEHLDGAYIAEAAPTAAAPMKRLRRRLALKWTSAAAGFCAIFLLVWQVVIPYVRYLPLDEPPTYDSAVYTAMDIGRFFATYMENGVATSSYTKIYVPSAEYLNVSAIPKGESIDIYERNKDAVPLNESEFTVFADKLLKSVSSAVNISVPVYEVERKEATSYGEASLRATFDRAVKNDYSFYINQEETGNYFSVRSASPLGEITLNDVSVAVDQTMSDAEMIASLGEIKEQLFRVFDVAFENIKILREYNNYSQHGATILSIYFYKAADDALNEYLYRPLSDYICLEFDNSENYSGDVVSDTVLSNVTIRYAQYRTDEVYTATKRVRMISLEEAERLLYNGYVFGGHSCPLCMANQDKVDFEGYDFVGLTYVFDYKTDGSSGEGLPFYTFYKKIGKAPNGNLIYAETYVPAIEVRGYEAYFKKQAEKHNS